MDWSTLFTYTFLIQLLSSSVRLGMPIIVASIGEVFAERAGLFNMSVEGMMLLGGFCGFVAAFYTDNLWLGIIGAMLVGAVISAVFSYWSISLKTDQVIAGFAIMTTCVGLAIYFNRLVFPTGRVFASISRFPTTPIPFLQDIPFFGRIFFHHNVMTYLFLILVPICYIILYKTPLGLRITAVGENPHAADTAGVNINNVRYIAVIIGGMLAGLGGAYYTLAELGMYSDSIIGGRGFIALALVVFGNWNPLFVFVGGLFFGLIDSLQFRLQILRFPIPSHLLIVQPYIMTILALMIGKGQRGPASVTKIYSRE